MTPNHFPCPGRALKLPARCLGTVGMLGALLMFSASLLAVAGPTSVPLQSATPQVVEFSVEWGVGGSPARLMVVEGDVGILSMAGSDLVYGLEVLSVESGTGKIELVVHELLRENGQFHAVAVTDVFPAQLGLAAPTPAGIPFGLLPERVLATEKLALSMRDALIDSDPIAGAICCASDGGVTAYGCAATVGSSSCCVPPCCGFVY